MSDGTAISTLITDGERAGALRMAHARAAKRLSSPLVKQLRADQHNNGLTRAWHFEVLRRVIYGETYDAIAKALHRKRATVSRIANSSEFKLAYRQALGNVRARALHDTTTDPVHTRILDEGLPSVERMVALRDTAPDPAVQVRAASNLLDRYERVTAAAVGAPQAAYIPDDHFEALEIAARDLDIRVTRVARTRA